MAMFWVGGKKKCNKNLDTQIRPNSLGKNLPSSTKIRFLLTLSCTFNKFKSLYSSEEFEAVL